MSIVLSSMSASRWVRNVRLGDGQWKRTSSSSAIGSSTFSLFEIVVKKLRRTAR